MSESIEVELLSSGNPVIVHVHPRRFPAIAVQGDTMYSWLETIEEVARGDLPPDELEWVSETLGAFLDTYERVLASTSPPTPYARRR